MDASTRNLINSVALIALAGVISYIVYQIFAENKKKQKHDRYIEIESSIYEIPSDETIFVLMTSMGEAHVPHTLITLFENAKCPTRITVGLVQHVPMANDGHFDNDPDLVWVDAVVKYKDLCKKNDIYCFADRIYK